MRIYNVWFSNGMGESSIQIRAQNAIELFEILEKEGFKKYVIKSIYSEEI